MRESSIRIWRHIRSSWLYSMLVMLIVVGGFRSAVADWYDVPTGSMKPTILVGDRIVVNKLAYDLKILGFRILSWADPQRGDIVTCSSPADGVRLVKRVVAVPGDVLELRHSRLYINGQPVDTTAAPPDAGRGMGEDAQGKVFWLEDLGGREHVVAISPEVRAVRDFGPVTVPAGKYFMMGDNRDHSGDSRYFGYVDRGAIAGRATGVALSLDREHGWKPRWWRFISKLS